MAHYLIRGSYTPETWAALVKNPQNRREVVQPLIESLGGKIEALYFAFGAEDVVAILEMPDNVSVGAASLAVTASGAFKSFQTTVLITPEEAVEMMRKAGTVGYRPPGT